MSSLDNQYWSERYTTGQTGWDTGGITPPLKEYFNQLSNKNLAILIPGCGNSHEAAYLLQQGFTNITLIDISEILCNHIRQKFSAEIPGSLTIICGNFFDHTGQYDLIVEQTFFCALNPALRSSYATKTNELLLPGGKLAGVFFNKNFDGGPPFGGSLAEYQLLFAPLYKIVCMEPCHNSITPRAGTELFVILQKA
jgi:methyl halide transferase